MLDLLTPCVLAASLLAAPAEEDLIAVTYDTSGLGPDMSHGELEVPLLPLAQSGDRDPDDFESEMSNWLYELLVDQLFADEFQYEGRRLDRVHGGLQVIAPAAVHDGVRTLLGHMEAVVRRSAVVELESFVVTDRRALPLGVRGDALDRLVSEGALRRLGVRRQRVRLGQPVLLEQIRHHDLLRGWDTEIATRVVSHSPHVDVVPSGSRTALVVDAAAPHGDRCVVRVMDTRSELAEVERRHIDPRDEVVLDDVTRELSDERRLDLSRLRHGAVSGSASLAPGESLVIGGLVDTLGGTAGGYLRVTLRSVDPSPAPVQVAGRQVALVDMRSQLDDPVEVSGVPSRWLGGRRDMHRVDQGYADFDIPAWEHSQRDTDWGDGLSEWLDAIEWQADGFWTHELQWFLLVGAEGSLERALSDLAARSPEPLQTAVDWRILDADGVTLALGRGMLHDRDQAVLIGGDSRDVVRGIETDVATNAVGQHPEVVPLFDGFWMQAGRRGGDVLLHMAWNRFLQWDKLPAGRGLEGMLDQLTTLGSDLRLRVPTDGREHEVAVMDGGLRVLAIATAAAHR